MCVCRWLDSQDFSFILVSLPESTIKRKVPPKQDSWTTSVCWYTVSADFGVMSTVESPTS